MVVINSVGTAYGARGSVSPLETATAVDVSGIEPVNKTVSKAIVSRPRPKQRAKYISTSGQKEKQTLAYLILVRFWASWSRIEFLSWGRPGAVAWEYYIPLLCAQYIPDGRARASSSNNVTIILGPVTNARPWMPNQEPVAYVYA